MICQQTNYNGTYENVLPFLVGQPSRQSGIKTSHVSSLSSRPVFSVETCARIELSLVPEVEYVFFEREGDGEFRIISVVNKRDAALREKVYAREEAIMQAYPGLSFDFHVMARMDRKLEDVISKAGKLVFER